MKLLHISALLALSGCVTSADIIDAYERGRRADREIVAYHAPATELAQNAPALSGTLTAVRSWQISCATTATPLSNPDGLNISAFRVWNNSTTAVYLGGSDVNTTTKGTPICTTTSCIDDDLSPDARATATHCIVASGTVTVTVIGGG